MKPDPPTTYPIDKYLSTDHPSCELVNILGEDDWSFEPAMKPEDDAMLQKLHDMLQSTAENLRDLSSEISRSHQPALQLKTRPTPLDDDFNEKVHLKEVVEAKFNGRILVDNKAIRKNVHVNHDHEIRPHQEMKERKVNAGVQVNISGTEASKRNNMKQSAQETVKICTNVNDTSNAPTVQLNHSRPPKVAYEELKSATAHNIEITPSLKCVIQEMPSIQIRGQLKEQKVLNLNILPNAVINTQVASHTNSVVIEINHDTIAPINTAQTGDTKETTRKVMVLPRDESSDSNINSNSETEMQPSQNNINILKGSTLSDRASDSHKPQRKIHVSILKSDDNAKNQTKKPATTRRQSDEWRRKLNVVYGKPSTSKTQGTLRRPKPQPLKKIPLGSKAKPASKQNNILNNAEYVPYSKLTLGGVNVSDIEDELANITNKADLPLSPILDKILSSQDNSFQESPRKAQKVTNKVIKHFSKSDENLLKEVLDIDRTIKKTLNKDVVRKTKPPEPDHEKCRPIHGDDNAGDESYGDDFEEEVEKSNQASGRSQSLSQKVDNDQSVASEATDPPHSIFSENSSSHSSFDKKEKTNNTNNKTYQKSSNLSLKNAVEVFEFVHSVDTQDTGTQSQTTQKISLKETQTSPRPESNVQPIHNELWNTTPLNTDGEVDNMFKLEKDMIKNLIIEEYGDIFELTKNIAKPSTSGVDSSDVDTVKGKNVASQPKNTQTSPSHVKSVMTSPMKTNTRTSSPFRKRLTVHRQASPLVVSKVEHSAPRVTESDGEDEGITINLSSPRFNLRLPLSSRDVISNLDSAGASSIGDSKSKDSLPQKKNYLQMSKDRKASSSESSWNESESDLSSLGEVNWQLRRARAMRSRHRMVPGSISSSASAIPSSVDAESDNAVPTKSDGEISFGQV